jgi:threonylcarbamoyladenosine tRNA methylthiotransferase MtaB
MNIYLDMVGCRLNQAEIETYARLLRAAGHQIVASPEKAELVVVNTCTVTTQAASDSRQKIRQAARKGATVVVTGCWSSMDPAAAQGIPGVKQVISNSNKDALVDLIFEDSLKSDVDVTRQPVAGTRSRTRAFIKVQDGCDNHCTYCITRLARGRGHSRPNSEIIESIRFAIAGGVKEAVLTGVQIGSWGTDLHPVSRLSELLKAVLNETDIPRIRLSSIEPWEVDEALITSWKNQRLCRHFHLPLQSGSSTVLKRMARKTSPQEYQALVSRIRTAIPAVSITTDIIVGFPGETDAEFEETLTFIQQIGFSGGHVFVFSARPGTPAASFPDQVAFSTRRQRSKILRELLSKQSHAFQQKFIDQQLEVLWERSVHQAEGWHSSGLTDNYLKVSAITEKQSSNNINAVVIQDSENGCLKGRMIEHGQ